MLGAEEAEMADRRHAGVGAYRQICNDVAAKGYEGFAMTAMAEEKRAAAS